MTDIVSPLFQWLNAHPQFAGLATFVISAAESVAIIGTIVPGSIMMTAIGALAGAGVIPLWGTIIWAILGAIVGDGVSYWIGYYFKDRLPNVWPFYKYPSLLKSGEKFFYKYGSMSVFIGRFVGPVRALVPLVAGMLGMKPWKFTLANVASAIGWAPTYMLPGILLGAAALELPPDIAMHVILVLLFLGLFILWCFWFIYKLLQLIHQQINQLQNLIWDKLKRSRYLSFTTVLLKYGDSKHTHGQLSLAFYCLIVLVMFFCTITYVKWFGPANIMVNDAMFHLFRGIRTHFLDNIMLFITLLGQKDIIFPLFLLLFAWFIFYKRWRTAFHALILCLLATGGVVVFKHLIKSPRPWGIVQVPNSYSLPSGHATISIAVFMGLAFIIANSLPPRRRWPIYAMGILLVLSVGVSRLYLGAHWFTDVIAGWLLGAAALLVVIISYQRHIERPIPPIGTLLVTLLTLALILPAFYWKNYNKLQTAYAQLNWPNFEINMADWWEKYNSIPAYRASLFGFPSQRINLEWEGDINSIREALLKEGWAPPPNRNFVSTLHRIADVSSTQYLPLVPPQYLDKAPELILTRSQDGEKSLLVLRLWNSNRTIKETDSPLWVGFVGNVPRSYSWIFRQNSSDVMIDPNLVFTKKVSLDHWQWKLVLVNKSSKKKPITYKILFIRTQPSAINQ